MPSLTTTHLSQKYSFPKTVVTDLRTSTRAEAVVTWTGAGGTPGTVTVKSLIDTLPGGSTMWDVCQFKRFDIYGAQIRTGSSGTSSDWPSITVTLNNTINSNYFGDIPTFYSDAVGFSKRAHVGITPNYLFQEAWIPSSRTDTVLTIVTDPNGSTSPYTFAVLVQFSVVLRSTPGTVSESVSATVTSAASSRHEVPMVTDYDGFVLTEEVPSTH